MATPLTDKVIATARAEIGYREGKTNGHWNNKTKYGPAVPGLEWADWQAWCGTFVSWVAMTAGAAELFPRTASCAAGVKWFRDRKRFSEYPAVGAQVFYGTGGSSHTGIVVSYTADTITTVEGNTNANGSAEGDGVYLKTRKRRDAYVYGYGYPDYPEGIQSADPAWAGKAPKPTAPSKPSKPTTPKPYAPPAFPAGLAPGRKSPSARGLQRALKAAGFMSAAIAEADTYGPATQAAVARFHQAHPAYRAAGQHYDPAIGPKGWAALHTIAYGRKK
ncbi:CHAP domain-containing protein [Streptomyces sp. NBC_00984]|uniref:C40 family peptidase n=1 Tax=Streptomyces sp. NBC_00984 TaxID=2903700 RepID=UPI0038669A45|nr:CHAP domain-containing protein [Streptomyces sp. NBC_00984]